MSSTKQPKLLGEVRQHLHLHQLGSLHGVLHDGIVEKLSIRHIFDKKPTDQLDYDRQRAASLRRVQLM
jgi:hypothetical protein